MSIIPNLIGEASGFVVGTLDVEALSKSNAVAVLIANTLYAHLFDEVGGVRVFLDDTPLLPEQYHLGSGVWSTAAQAPSIWIDDKGSRAKEESLGGALTNGALDPGFTEDTYSFDIEVWLKGRPDEFMRYEMNRWRDAVQACLREYWHLGDQYRRLQCEPAEGDPATNAWGEGSATMWAGTVRATVMAMVAQRASAL